MPQLGDFGVVRTNGLAARLIRFGTRSTVNHAFVYVGDGVIVEAQPGGAKLSPASDYPDAIWSSMDLDTHARGSISHHAEQLVGTPYNWLDIAALALACYGIRSHAIDRRIERMDRLICSQLVDRAYELAGEHLFNDGRLPSEVTPQDLLALIRKAA